MDYNDVTIHIDVQANPLTAIEIRELVRETFIYMPPWKMVGNALFAPSDSRFFALNLTTYDFIWLRSNNSYDDSMDEENTFIIRDTADMSWLLEFIALNQITFRKHTGLNLEKLKQKLAEYDKLANPPKKSLWGQPSEQDMADALMAIQPMAYPAGKVFYMDYVNTATGISPKYLDKDEIAAKAKEIAKLKKMAVAGGHALKFPVSVESKITLADIEKKMAQEVQNEIDAAILAKLTAMADAQGVGATVGYPWSKGWSWESEKMAHDMAEHEKAKLKKYAYKKFNPEYYGKITMSPNPNIPMDY